MNTNQHTTKLEKLKEQLRRTVELSEKATPGPWGIERTTSDNWIGPMRNPSDGKIHTIVVHNDRYGLKDYYRDRNDADAEAIAHTRNTAAAHAAGYLLAIEALEKMVGWQCPNTDAEKTIQTISELAIEV